MRDDCKFLEVEKDICYVRFRKGIKTMYCIEQFKTANNENIIIDLDSRKRVIGIEIIGKKPCQIKLVNVK